MRHAYRRHRNPQTHEHQEQAFFSNKTNVAVQKKEERTPFFQANGLSIGRPGDKYEQEADSVADAVVSQPSNVPAIHKKEISSNQGESLETSLEEEKEAPDMQMMEEEREEKPVVQTKSESGGSTINSSLTHQIRSSTGRGTPLPRNTQAEMESAFGTDFSGVHIHTNEEAVSMNKSLHAQAFTNGKDIYFNSGKFNPGTSAGKHLLAHELTHVVQQSNEPTANIQKNELQKPCPPRLGPDDPVPQGWQEYHGDPSWFHCGFRGILEDRTPTPEEPQNECFYDHDANLVDENHEYAGCRGTPNQYDSSSNWFKHTFLDTGGIWHRGWEAYEESRRYEEQEGNPIQAQKDCVKRLGGCPETRPAGIPTPEDIRQYNEQCRQETRYRGNDVTPDCGS